MNAAMRITADIHCKYLVIVGTYQGISAPSLYCTNRRAVCSSATINTSVATNQSFSLPATLCSYHAVKSPSPTSPALKAKTRAALSSSEKCIPPTSSATNATKSPITDSLPRG
jgi:hypothetical protein